MPFTAAAALALIMAASGAKAHSGSWEQQWKKVRTLTAALDFEGALPLLKALVAEPEVPPAPRAQMLLELGVTHVNLGDADAARSAFARALTFDATVALSALAPPKAVQLLEQEREKLAPAQTPPPEPAPAPAAPPARETTPTVVPAPAGEPTPQPAAHELVAEPPPALSQRRHITLPFIATGLGAVVGFGIGLGLALESQQIATELATTRRPGAEAAGLMSNRDALSAGAITAYAVSAALAVIAAVLLIRGIDDST